MSFVKADQGWVAMHWLMSMVFWFTISVATASGTLWPVVLVAQTLMASLAECYFAIFTSDHVYEAPLSSWHNVFCLWQAALTLVALLFSLSSHQMGFYLPVRQRIVGDVAGEKDAAVYATPLSRTRPEHVPMVRTPERAASILARFSFGWVTPILRLGTKTTIDSGDLYMLAPADRPLSIWRRYT
ncbi:hypothetical protein LPJ57_002016, partial [Coemansia sp. RSA 486]